MPGSRPDDADSPLALLARSRGWHLLDRTAVVGRARGLRIGVEHREAEGRVCLDFDARAVSDEMLAVLRTELADGRTGVSVARLGDIARIEWDEEEVDVRRLDAAIDAVADAATAGVP